MRISIVPCALALSASVLTAQSASSAPTTPPPAELGAATARLAAALQKCAGLPSATFTMRWAPVDQKKDDDNPLVQALRQSASGATAGSWQEERLHVKFANELNDELLVVGRHTLARDEKNGWRMRAGRFADGNPTTYVPDVPLLLQQLAAMDLAVTHRAPGTLDDRPVEVLTISLSPAQISQLAWSGALPDALVAPITFRGPRLLGVGGVRPPAAAPDADVDLAVHLDPGTSLVHKLLFRGYANNPAGAGAAGVFMVAGGGGRVIAGAGAEDGDEEEEATPKTEGALLDNGLPDRARGKRSVADVVVTLSEHGTAEAPALSDEQKKLLGR